MKSLKPNPRNNFSELSCLPKCEILLFRMMYHSQNIAVSKLSNIN